jgi:SAM-dependent methyltransferase
VHRRASTIIRRHSTNRDDVREVALAGLDLEAAQQVLDLGCGFGFMSIGLAERTAPTARLLGVDVCEQNRAAYLRAVGQTGRQARFECLRIRSALPWPSASFDLVVASYSLYFFIEALPEIARVLRPHGLFLTITHSECSSLSLCRAVGLPVAASPLVELSRLFSAENGREQLTPHFRVVEIIRYPNALRFAAGDFADLTAYVRFKLPELVPQRGKVRRSPRLEPQQIARRLTRDGALVLDKQDAIFRCRGPRCV